MNDSAFPLIVVEWVFYFLIPRQSMAQSMGRPVGDDVAATYKGDRPRLKKF